MNDSLELLDRAVAYALDVLPAVTPELLSRPTPCRGWNLRMLLDHMIESLAALEEGVERGRISLDASSPADASTDVVQTIRVRAGQLVDTWTAAARTGRVVTIEGCPLPAEVAVGVGALEIAVHSWDVSCACGDTRPIPEALAVELLTIAPLLVQDEMRSPMFAPALPVAPTAEPSDRVVAFLGRRPA
jgi:uncharacterized protein (TIGR03086 family)